MIHTKTKDLEELLGHTALRVDTGEASLRFDMADGRSLFLEHFQEGAERVTLEVVWGSPASLVGSPILLAQESTSTRVLEEGDGFIQQQWTTYLLLTVRGSLFFSGVDAQTA